MGGGPRNPEVVRTVISVAQNPGLVVSEGVESAAQVNPLRTLDGLYARGLFCSKPVELARARSYAAGDEVVGVNTTSPRMKLRRGQPVKL